MRRATPRQHRSYLGTVHDASSHLDRRPVVEYLVYTVHVATGMRQNSQPSALVLSAVPIRTHRRSLPVRLSSTLIKMTLHAMIHIQTKSI